MNQDIQAIFLDLGNTLRIVLKDEAHIIHEFRQLLDHFPARNAASERDA